MPRFEPWSAEHWLVIVLTFTLPVAIGLWVRRARSEIPAHVGALGLAIVLLGQLVAGFFLIGLPHAEHWSDVMPLQLCHFALFACVAACFFRNQLSYDLAYFWGLGGTLQGIFTPALAEGFPSAEFIVFFIGHSGIVGAVVYLALAFRMRPFRRSILRAYVSLLLYAVIAGGFNAIFGTNYGFLCEKPAAATLFDWLGPWPWYIASSALLAFVVFHLLYLPWEIADRLSRNHAVEKRRLL